MDIIDYRGLRSPVPARNSMRIAVKRLFGAENGSVGASEQAAAAVEAGEPLGWHPGGARDGVR